MTAQATNSLLYDGREWSIEGRYGLDYFIPEAEGLHCREMHTACYRGWVATFRINDERTLCIDRLVANLDTEYHAPENVFLFNRPPTPAPTWGWPYVVYESINAPIRFTGGLLVGDDYQHNRYLMAYTFPAIDYATVHELIFDNGTLIEEYDRSELFEALFQFNTRLNQELRHPNEIGREAFSQILKERNRRVQEKMAGKLFFDNYQDAEFDG